MDTDFYTLSESIFYIRTLHFNHSAVPQTHCNSYSTHFTRKNIYCSRLHTPSTFHFLQQFAFQIHLSTYQEAEKRMYCLLKVFNCDTTVLNNRCPSMEFQEFVKLWWVTPHYDLINSWNFISWKYKIILHYIYIELRIDKKRFIWFCFNFREL